MNKKHLIRMSAVLALTGSLGGGMLYAAGQSQTSGGGDNQPSAFGRVGNQGEGFTEDQTIKGKGRLPESTPRQDSQITLGGARPVVIGPILAVQGDDYIIRDTSDTEVRVRVNKDTDMDCVRPGAQGTTMSTGRQADDQREIPPTAHMQERMGAQGQSEGRQGQRMVQGRQEEQKGQQILQQNQERQAKSQSGQSSEAQAGMPSGHQRGMDERTNDLDRNADLGKGQLGPHDSETSASQSGKSSGTQTRQQTAQSQQGMSQGKQSSASGERVGDQSGTQSQSAMNKDSGGDIARGSGFRFGSKGDCSFKTGDVVRAEVSDLGTVLYIKYLSDQEKGTQQRMSGQMLVPSDEPTVGEQQSAQQRAQMMRPGSVPAPGDLQSGDATTRRQQTAKAQPQNLCEGCKLIRGLVLRSDSKSLVVKDAGQSEITLKVDQTTRMGNFSQPRAATFMEGDRIEAYVKPDGIAWSITGMKQQQGQPGVAGAPGD